MGNRRVAAGRLPGPPIAQTLDFGIEEVAPGRVVFIGRDLDEADLRRGFEACAA